MSEFDWQTDDNWDEDLRADHTPGRQFPVWFFPLLLLGLVGVGSGIAILLTGRSADQTTSDTTITVAQNYAILYEVAETHDGTLFSALISNDEQDETWANAYTELVDGRGLLDRSALNLNAPRPVPFIREPIDLAPDLNSALITTTLEYNLDVGNGLTQTINLAHSNRFARDENGDWLLMPFPPSYWGSPIAIDGRRYNINAPGRDADLIRQLHQDLENLTIELCQIGYDCDEIGGIRIVLDFTTDPAILNEWEPFTLLQRGEPGIITLPTPSLVGIPTDRTSYHALLSGYSHHILPQMMMLGSNYDCCAHEPWFWGVAFHQLHEQGLLANPLRPTDYEAMIEPDKQWELGGWDDASEWDYDDFKLILALVQFIEEQFAPTRPIGQFHKTLRLSSSAVEWLQRNSLSNTYNDDAILANWGQAFPDQFQTWLAYQSIR